MTTEAAGGLTSDVVASTELLQALRALDSETGLSMATAGDLDRDGRSDVWVGLGPMGRTHDGGLLVISANDGEFLVRLRARGAPHEYAFGLAIEPCADIDGDTVADVAVAAWRPGQGSVPARLRLHLLSGAAGCVLRQIDVPGAAPAELFEWPWHSPMISLRGLVVPVDGRLGAFVVARGGEPELLGPLGSLLVFSADGDGELSPRSIPVPAIGPTVDFQAAAVQPLGGSEGEPTVLAVAFRPNLDGRRITGGGGMAVLAPESGLVRWVGAPGFVVTGMVAIGDIDGDAAADLGVALVDVHGRNLESSLALLSGRTGEVLASIARAPNVMIRALSALGPGVAADTGRLVWIEEGRCEKRPVEWEWKLCHLSLDEQSATCPLTEFHAVPSTRTLLVAIGAMAGGAVGC